MTALWYPAGTKDETENAGASIEVPVRGVLHTSEGSSHAGAKKDEVRGPGHATPTATLTDRGGRPAETLLGRQGKSNILPSIDPIPGVEESADRGDHVDDRAAGERAMQPSRSMDNPGAEPPVVVPRADHNDHRLLRGRRAPEPAHAPSFASGRCRSVFPASSRCHAVDAALTRLACDSLVMQSVRASSDRQQPHRNLRARPAGTELAAVHHGGVTRRRPAGQRHFMQAGQ